MTAPVWMRYPRRPVRDKIERDPLAIGRSGRAGRDERTPLEAPEGLDLEPIPEDRTLVEMFEAGELMR